MIINNRPVCPPIISIVNELISKGCTIEKQILNDYHFDEMLFVIKKPSLFNEEDVTIPTGIEKVNNQTYTCNCHWSTVKLG